MAGVHKACFSLFQRFFTHSLALTHTPTNPSLLPLPLSLLFFFCQSVGRDRDRHKKDGPVCGIENGPYCFTRDSGGRVER